MRTIIRQPHIIDVTPEGEPVHRSWLQRAGSVFLMLLAAVAIPILWMIGILTALAVLGLGALAVAALPLWLRLKR
jgi:uncharacterized membrane protein